MLSSIHPLSEVTLRAATARSYDPEDAHLNAVVYGGALAVIGCVASVALAPVLAVAIVESAIIGTVMAPALVAAMEWASGDNPLKGVASDFLKSRDIKKFDQLKLLSREINKEHDALSRQIAIATPSPVQNENSKNCIFSSKPLSQSFSSVAAPKTQEEKQSFIPQPSAGTPARNPRLGQRR